MDDLVVLEKKYTDEEIVKALTEKINDFNGKHYILGTRAECDDLDASVRSKAIRAFLHDVFADQCKKSVIQSLEDAIDQNVEFTK